MAMAMPTAKITIAKKQRHAAPHQDQKEARKLALTV